MARYAKAVIAAIGAVLTWATATFPADPTVAKWVGLATALLTVATVYLVPNADPKP